MIFLSFRSMRDCCGRSFPQPGVRARRRHSARKNGGRAAQVQWELRPAKFSRAAMSYLVTPARPRSRDSRRRAVVAQLRARPMQPALHGVGGDARNDAAPTTVIVRESGRSSIPETPAMKWIDRGVLDPPHARGMTAVGEANYCPSCEERQRRSNPAFSVCRSTDCVAGARSDGVPMHQLYATIAKSARDQPIQFLL